MDYTNRPHINRQPALVNFLFLEQLYGVVAGSQVTVSSNAMGDQDEMKSVFAGTKDEQDKVTAAEQDTNKNDDNDNDNDTPVEFTDAQDEKDQDNEEEDDKKEDDKKKEDKKKNKKKDDRRHLRSSTADAITSHYHPDDHPMVPHRVLRSLESVEEEIENGLWTAENGWNVLHRGEHGEAHEKHLGDGFRVQIHLLLAYEDE